MRCIKFTGIQTDHPILARWPDRVLIKKKIRNYHLVGFVIPGDNWGNMKECKR